MNANLLPFEHLGKAVSYLWRTNCDSGWRKDFVNQCLVGGLLIFQDEKNWLVTGLLTSFQPHTVIYLSQDEEEFG